MKSLFVITVDAEEFPDIALALAYEDHERASSLCIKELFKDPLNPSLLLQVAYFFFKRKEFKKAIKTVKTAAKFRPRDPSIHFLTAAAYSCLFDPKKCLKELKIVDSLMMNTPLISRCIALEYCNLKNFNKALIYLNKALELNSKDFDTFYAFAVFYKEKGNIDKALHWINLLLRKEPLNEEYNNLLTEILNERNKKIQT